MNEERLERANRKLGSPYRQAQNLYAWYSDPTHADGGAFLPVDIDGDGHLGVKVIAETNTAVNFNPDAMGEQIMASGGTIKWLSNPTAGPISVKDDGVTVLELVAGSVLSVPFTLAGVVTVIGAGLGAVSVIYEALS